MLSPLQLYALLYAVAEVKTAFDENTRGQRGEAGVLLLPSWLVQDVNTFTSQDYRLSDRLHDEKSFEIAVAYIQHYGKVYEKRFKRPIGEREAVLILHYGYEKAGQGDEEGIWKKVEEELK